MSQNSTYKRWQVQRETHQKYFVAVLFYFLCTCLIPLIVFTCALLSSPLLFIYIGYLPVVSCWFTVFCFSVLLPVSCLRLVFLDIYSGSVDFSDYSPVFLMDNYMFIVGLQTLPALVSFYQFCSNKF